MQQRTAPKDCAIRKEANKEEKYQQDRDLDIDESTACSLEGSGVRANQNPLLLPWIFSRQEQL
jgi:hypothetical protein